MVITLNCVSELGPKSKKTVEYKKQFETHQMLVENYINKNGTVSRKFCLVRQDGEYHKIKGRFEEISKLNNKLIIKGFGN